MPRTIYATLVVATLLTAPGAITRADDAQFVPDLNLRTPGIDMSHYQGLTIDWAQVKSDGIAFVMAKATEGEHTLDADFAGHVTGANGVGIPVGAYHYFRLGQPAAPQAQYFLNTIAEKSLQLRPALDFEGAPSEADLREAVEWLRLVAEETGCQPVLYIDFTNYSTMASLNLVPANQPVWLASYARDLPSHGLPDMLWFWQHSSSQSVTGIDGYTDTDWFFGRATDLAATGCAEAE